jgi:hypothetical protein
MIPRLAAAVTALTLMTLPATAYAQASPADKDAVRLAALDYLEGIYNVQPERIERSVHTTLVKRGSTRMRRVRRCIFIALSRVLR